MVEEGWLRLRGVLAPSALAAVQAEATRVEAETRPEWRHHVDGGTRPAHHEGSTADGYGPTHHVVYPCLAESDVFTELIAHPAIVCTLHAFMGATFVNSDNGLCIKQAQSRTHVGWHRDAGAWQSLEAGQALAGQPAQREFWQTHRAVGMETPMQKIKVMIFLDDIGEHTAPFSVVPGSHRLQQGESYTDADGVTYDARHGALRDDPAKMPGHIKLTGRAGDIGESDLTPNRALRSTLCLVVHPSYVVMAHCSGIHGSVLEWRDLARCHGQHGHKGA